MDWNWYFSALAQSCAAIVGIFAAFIITKIVNNQIEFKRKLSEIESHLINSLHIKDKIDNRYIEWYNNQIRNEQEMELIELVTTEESDDPSFYYNKLNFSIYDNKQLVLDFIKTKIEKFFIKPNGKMHVKLEFQIVEVMGNKAQTRFKGHSFARDYLRFLVRRRRTRIDAISTVKTKDGVPFRITATGFTIIRSKTSKKDAIRRKMLEVISERASQVTSEDFIREVTGGKLSSIVYSRAKSIYPLKGIEIQKTKILKPISS